MQFITRSLSCVIIVAALLVSSADAQDDKKPAAETSPPKTKMSELERVQEISKLTGRPIFAVAGQST